MNRQPLVSVVIPTWNRSALLAEAIASVRAQSLADWECVVADDGSTDDTAAVVEQQADERMQLVRTAHSGNPARSRNAGVAAARGRYLAFLDDDDLWLPEKLATQLPLLQQGARWACSGFAHTDLQRNRSREFGVGHIVAGRILGPLLELRAAVALPTVIVERSLLTEVGGFDESLPTRHDYDCWLALAERAEAAATPEILTLVRSHPGNVPRSTEDRHLRTAQVYRKWLTRLRDPAHRAICHRRFAECLLEHGIAQARSGDRFGGAATIARSIAIAPMTPAIWRRLGSALARRARRGVSP